jgi:hypothetical protein
MPTPTIPDGKLFMNATLYTGNGSSPRAFTGIGFAPDFVWIKSRTTAADHALIDSVRGTGSKALSSNNTSAENGDGLVINSFDSDGYTLATGSINFSYANTNAATYVGWQWKAGGAAVTNTAGTISSQVSANTTSGFSVVTYTGTGASATVGHGLGVAPKFIIYKNRVALQNWMVTTTVIDGSVDYLFLNTTAAKADSADGAPTSSVLNLSGYGQNNGSSEGIVAYCFAPIAGYSAFGSYTGNGSADGPFIYTGFRPRYVMVKRTDSSESWYVLDTARSPFNVPTAWLAPNLSNAEGTDVLFDILSNGFKQRSTSSNASGGTYIYMAFCENPFKYSNAR